MSEEKHTHVHVLEDGTVIEHSHDHAHGHHHTNTKAVLNRLSRAIGHMESIKRMVEEGRDCTEEKLSWRITLNIASSMQSSMGT